MADIPGPLRRLRALFANPEPAPPAPRRRAAVLPPRRATLCNFANEHHKAVIDAARALPDGTPASAELIAAVDAEIAARRHGLGLEDGPAAPLLSGLQIRRDGLPDWWEETQSLMLVSPESNPPEVTPDLFARPFGRALVVVGAGVTAPKFALVGFDPLVAIGDRVTMFATSFTVGDGATILIGEHTTATFLNFGDIRNGGALIVGKDCMFASGVSFLSYDSHAIRDAETGVRVNLRGGRIVVEDHVWICDQVRMMGDTRVRTGAVIGANSFVKSLDLPANTISVGRPAHPIRSGIIWTREDAP